MLKASTSILIIFALFVVSLRLPVYGQTPKAEPAVSDNSPDTAYSGSKDKKADFKRSLKEKTAALDKKSAQFDPKDAEKLDRQQPPKPGWTTKEKLLLVAVIIGIAAVVFLGIKYGKDCIRSDPPGCTPGVDEFCTCEEYAKKK